MLASVGLHSKQLAELWAKASSSERFRYLNADAFYSPAAPANLRKEEWVSVFEGRVIGYLCALIDGSTRSVADISVINFVEDRRFGLDFLTFLKRLRGRYRYLRWAAVSNHPQHDFYSAIARKYGGRVVGTFSKKIKLNDGRLYDETWYEVPCDNR